MRQFKRIYIEITNVCNADCRACPKTSRKPEFMGRDLFKKIIDEVRGYSGHLYFHVMGEPLLHPDIGMFLDLCGEKGFEVNITTNGMQIKETGEMLLSKPAIRAMNFSLNRFDKNTEIKEIDEYLDEVFRFINASGTDSGMIICFRLWNMEKGQDTGRNSYILQKLENFFEIPHRIEKRASDGNGFKLRNNIYVSQRLFFDWPDKSVPDLNEEGFCLGLRQQVAILVDGTVVPCCLDNEGTIDLGNINNMGFKQIIEGKRARDIYKGFSERKVVEELCRKCGYRERFK